MYAKIAMTSTQNKTINLLITFLWGAEEALSKYVLWIVCTAMSRTSASDLQDIDEPSPKVKAPRNGKAILWSEGKC